MKYEQEIFIGNKKIHINSPVYFIADIAANHDNDIKKAKNLICLAAEAGADAVKFQHFKAETIVSDFGFKELGSRLSHQSKWKKSVYDIYKEASLNIAWTKVLKETCEKAGIGFLTSPYSISLVNEVDQFISAYKIGSGDITFLKIIDYISKKNKPVILSTGASTMTDVKRAVDTILRNNKNIVLLQCNTNYTASNENFKYINLKVLSTFKLIYPGMILGLSDHTHGFATVLGAIALGAKVIEKHFTDDNNLSGPDHLFSMNPITWKEMVKNSRRLEMAMGDGNKDIEGNEKETLVLQRRCLRAARSLTSQTVLTSNDVTALRPAPKFSYEPFRLSELIGKKILVSKVKGEAIFEKDIVRDDNDQR